MPAPAAISQQSKRAEVAYAQGSLVVSANNSSLNQILRQISRETGIKISGGVADERVFGRYGPSSPSQVLSALLDGTGSNMLLVHRDGSTPAELILTPRLGGPTPPNPSAAIFNEPPEPAPATESARGAGQNRPASPSAPPDRSAAPLSPTANNPSPQGGEPQSPNGVKTPQQIYDQLQLLRNQQPPSAPR